MLIDSGFSAFKQKIQKERLVCFGVSKHLEKMAGFVDDLSWTEFIDFFVDNDKAKQKETIIVNGKEFVVKSPDELKNYIGIILITAVVPKAICDIIAQLIEITDYDKVIIMSLYMMENHYYYDNSCVEQYIRSHKRKIEKKIHCFWTGGEIPESLMQCRDSWLKICPDYEIVEWNDKNYDVSKNKYIKQAYESGKWAFVSDYVRLDVLYKYGGIYLDYDVEMLRPLDDLLCFDAFMSFHYSGLVNIGSGFGAVKGSELVGRLLDQYTSETFLAEGEKYSSKTILMQPDRQMPIFEEYGYRKINKSQVIGDIAFLSPDYINCFPDRYHNRMYLRGNEYMVHWIHASWYDDSHQEEREIANIYRDKLYSLNWEREVNS